MLKKVYLEISNVCNLECEFCHGTKRRKKLMNKDEFESAAKALVGHTESKLIFILSNKMLNPCWHIFGETKQKVVALVAT